MTDAAKTSDDLHRELKERLRWLCSIFGQPSDLLHLLAITDWRRLRTWIRGVEALAAQLIRALASTMPALPAAAPQPASAQAPDRVAPDTDYPDSDRWIGVRFRWPDEASERAPRTDAPCSVVSAVQPSASREPTPRGLRSARRLALRLEAVIRVAENAHRYAKRLARRSARPHRQTPGRIAPPVPSIASIAAPEPPTGPPIRPPVIETG